MQFNILKNSNLIKKLNKRSLEITIYQPKNKVLQNYIECFYTLKRKDNDKSITYMSFPTNTIFVTLCQNAEVIIDENNLIIKVCNDDKIKSILVVDNQKQGSTTYIGKTNEISIYFKPLGINAFLEKPLSYYKTKAITKFKPFEDYDEVINAIFKIEEELKQIECLENYLATKLNHFNHPFLNRVIASMTDTDNPKLKIAEIAKKNLISRTTLNKHFLLHIGTCPSQFIKIERFRNAIKRFTKNATKDQLVDIAYWVDYFDQSHMIKDFKSLTGYSPKSFFSSLSQIENNQINWIFF